MIKKALLFSTIAISSVLQATDSPLPISALNQYANTLVTSPSQIYTDIKNSNSNFKVGTDVYVSSTYNFVNIPVSYVYDNKFGVSVYLPYIESDFDGRDTQNGVGDVTFEVSFNAGSFDVYPQEENNIFGLRYTQDTGDEKKGLGMGASSIAIFWDTNIILDEWSFYGSLLWTYYISDVETYGMSYTPGYEDMFFIGASHKCLLSDKVDTALKLNWQYKGEDELDNGADIDNSDYNIVDVTLQWKSDKLIKDIPVQAGVKIPIWNSNAHDNEFLFFVGIGGLF